MDNLKGEKKVQHFWVVDENNNKISGPFSSHLQAIEDKDRLNIENNTNYTTLVVDVGFYDEKGNIQFYHKCEKCDCSFYSDKPNDYYCGGCETEIEDETGESPLPPTIPVETMTIPELKIVEANQNKVYEMLVKPIIEKADEIINLLNGLNPPKAKGKKSKDTQRLFNIADDLVAHHYKQPKKEEKIIFTNRANTEYKLVQEDLLDLGYQENYKDVFHKGLDPIVSRDKPVFGLGRVLQPLNKTISAMKKSIDEATNTAHDRYNKYFEAQAKAKQEAEAKAQTEAQGGTEGANN